jgi:hypothetical protein
VKSHSVISPLNLGAKRSVPCVSCPHLRITHAQNLSPIWVPEHTRDAQTSTLPQHIPNFEIQLGCHFTRCPNGPLSVNIDLPHLIGICGVRYLPDKRIGQNYTKGNQPSSADKAQKNGAVLYRAISRISFRTSTQRCLKSSHIRMIVNNRNRRFDQLVNVLQVYLFILHAKCNRSAFTSSTTSSANAVNVGFCNFRKFILNYV